MTRFSILILGLLGLLLGLSSAARAAEDNPYDDEPEESASAETKKSKPAKEAPVKEESEARKLFKEGRSLAAEGRHAEACPKFEQSLQLEAGVGTRFNLADCYE